jgi:hypothetical protein
MKKILVFLMAVLTVLSVDFAFAEGAAAPAGGSTVSNGTTRTPLANKRMRRQRRRVKQGVKSGQLTKDETKELAADHKELRNEIKDAKSDGKVTKEERKQIQKDQNAESKKIYDLKHNDATQK